MYCAAWCAWCVSVQDSSADLAEIVAPVVIGGCIFLAVLCGVAVVVVRRRRRALTSDSQSQPSKSQTPPPRTSSGQSSPPPGLSWAGGPLQLAAVPCHAVPCLACTLRLACTLLRGGQRVNDTVCAGR